MNPSISYLVLIPLLFICISGCNKSDEIIKGCTLKCASNYNSNAEIDDGSCIGCKNNIASNYCPDAPITDDDSCDCFKKGNIIVENNSQTAIYRIIIDEIFQKYLRIGETDTFSLSSGTHVIQFGSYLSLTSTGGSCFPMTVVVPECETIMLSCTTN